MGAFLRRTKIAALAALVLIAGGAGGSGPAEAAAPKRKYDPPYRVGILTVNQRMALREQAKRDRIAAGRSTRKGGLARGPAAAIRPDTVPLPTRSPAHAVVPAPQVPADPTAPEIAALLPDPGIAAPPPSITGSTVMVRFRDGIRDDCTPPELRRVLEDLAVVFGPVLIASSHRTLKHNARVGGATHSFHLECRAVDFLVRGPVPKVVEFLKARSEVGGYKRYPGGHYHIDNGPRRTW